LCLYLLVSFTIIIIIIIMGVINVIIISINIISLLPCIIHLCPYLIGLIQQTLLSAWNNPVAVCNIFTGASILI
jgi:hypothetical protein